jgi:4-deoxy-L-threo-5-hexosulose-uronate ketol-isomerase
MKIEERWGTNPVDFRAYDTARIRQEFLVESLFEAGRINMVYTHNDRLVIGGAEPAGGRLQLGVPDLLRAEYFCERREMGVVCIEGEGVLEVDGARYKMGYKDAVYVGRGSREVVFGGGAKFYFASAPAHAA